MCFVRVDRKEAEFIGIKQTNRQTLNFIMPPPLGH